jgi:hypothetical protein
MKIDESNRVAIQVDGDRCDNVNRLRGVHVLGD